MRAREEKEKGRGKGGANRVTPGSAIPVPCLAEFAGATSGPGGRGAPAKSRGPGAGAGRRTNERWPGFGSRAGRKTRGAPPASPPPPAARGVCLVECSQ